MKIIAALLGASIAMPGVAGTDIVLGKKIVQQQCLPCHAQGGNGSDPAFPVLAGQKADYLAYALHAYKTGTRKNPIMQPIAEKLSNHDIQNLAAYFSAQPSRLYFSR